VTIAKAEFYTDWMPFLSHNHYQQCQSTGQETLIVIKNDEQLKKITAVGIF